MDKEFSPEAQRTINTVTHLRKDCEQACLLNELLMTFDQEVDEATFESLPIGIKRSAIIVQKSLISNLLLTLTRAYDSWDEADKRRKDRMSLEAVFKPLQKHRILFDEIVQSDRQKHLFEEANKKWLSLENSYSHKVLTVALNFENGVITQDEYQKQKAKLNIKKVHNNLRNEILAHNLPKNNAWPTKSEIRSLLLHTLEIVGPLSEAFAGISVSFDCVTEVCRGQARAYWKLWRVSFPAGETVDPKNEG